jgi:VWFA-related protein
VLRRSPRFLAPKLNLVLVSVCVVASAVLSAPQPQQATAQSAENKQAAPPLRVTAHLVQANVIVNDKHGNPITGLSQKDFTILDNGNQQEIRVFAAQTNLPSTSFHSTILPPGTYTNRPEEQTNIPASVTVILLDALNTEFADRVLARKQVIRVLQQIQPQEYVALYWLGDGLHVLHDFTTDASVLHQVLADYNDKPNNGADDSNVADPSLNSPNASTPAGTASERSAFRAAADQRTANLTARDRVRATAAALIAVANHLETQKGRKNLVWVSSSFPITLGYDKFNLQWTNDTGEDFAADVERVARALTDADIAVYPVDARGLLGSDINANEDDLDAHIGDPTDGDTHLPTRGAPEKSSTMRLLAERTGGKAFYGTNDIAGAIRQAMNDSRVTYTLGYYPADVKWDGSFHELKVKVATPGAQVRARGGYYAFPDAPLAAPRNDHLLIAKLATSWLPATGIGLHVDAQTSQDSGAHTLTAVVSIDLGDISMQKREGRWAGTVQSVFLQMDNAGPILKVDDRTFHPDFDNNTYELGLKGAITDTRQFHILPNATELCIVVRDASTANLGSIYLPLAQYSPDSSQAGQTKR